MVLQMPTRARDNVTTKLIYHKKNPKLGLTVSVRGIDMDFPESAEQMEAALTEHVLCCRHCLAMILSRDETLAELGCDEYLSLLAEKTRVLQMRESRRSSADIDEDMPER
jgi:hypothetical protein